MYVEDNRFLSERPAQKSKRHQTLLPYLRDPSASIAMHRRLRIHDGEGSYTSIAAFGLNENEFDSK